MTTLVRAQLLALRTTRALPVTAAVLVVFTVVAVVVGVLAPGDPPSDGTALTTLVRVPAQLVAGDAPEARAKGAAAHAGVEVSGFGLEPGGIERFGQLTGEEHLRRAQPAVGRFSWSAAPAPSTPAQSTR